MSVPFLSRLHAWRALGQNRWLLLALVVAVNLIDETSGLPSTVLAVTGDEPKADDKRPQFLATYRDGPPDMVMYSEGRHSGPLLMSQRRRRGGSVTALNGNISHFPKVYPALLTVRSILFHMCSTRCRRCNGRLRRSASMTMKHGSGL